MYILPFQITKIHFRTYYYYCYYYYYYYYYYYHYYYFCYFFTERDLGRLRKENRKSMLMSVAILALFIVAYLIITS